MIVAEAAHQNSYGRTRGQAHLITQPQSIRSQYSGRARPLRGSSRRGLGVLTRIASSAALQGHSSPRTLAIESVCGPGRGPQREAVILHRPISGGIMLRSPVLPDVSFIQTIWNPSRKARSRYYQLRRRGGGRCERGSCWCCWLQREIKPALRLVRLVDEGFKQRV